MTRLAPGARTDAALERYCAAGAGAAVAFVEAIGILRPELTELEAAGALARAARDRDEGGVTGYKGRELFTVPGEPTPLPAAGVVAWNPSVTGGGKSENTALVTSGRHEIVTRTPELP